MTQRLNKLKDCTRNTTAVYNPRQNLVRDKIQSKTNIVRDKIQSGKNFSDRWEKILGLHFVSDFQCTF